LNTEIKYHLFSTSYLAYIVAIELVKRLTTTVCRPTCFRRCNCGLIVDDFRPFFDYCSFCCAM